MVQKKVVNRVLILIVFTTILIPAVTAAETGGYIVQPAYDLYPEYSDLYFTPRSADSVLLNEPEPSQIPLSDLPPWILVILGIGAATPVLFYLGKYLSVTGLPVVGGFSRLTRKNILDNSSRKTIYRYVKENPGVQLADLNKLTGFTYKNLIYHLNLLIRTGMITAGECKNTTRYFENSGQYSPEERTMLMYLNHQKDKNIIEVVFHNPGISRGEISSLVGISGPTISWHMHFLRNDDIIEQKKEGTIVRHYLSEKMIKVYDDLSPGVSV